MNQSVKISLDKRIEELNRDGHTEMAKMVSACRISLKKNGLGEGHRAKGALIMDISASMRTRFANDTVGDLVKKALAQAILFDDDGMIDVFLFGESVSYAGEVGVKDLSKFCNDLKKTSLEGYTYYDKAIDFVVEHYKNDKSELPVFAMFITDGSPSDKGAAERSLIAASNYPVFFQFIGVGDGDYFPSNQPVTPQEPKKGFLKSIFGSSSLASSETQRVPRNFEFLAKLDDLSGRRVDNAGFFAINEPKSFDNEKLYDLLTFEYPGWIPKAKSAGIL